jgi:hypothetical protein
MSDFWFGFGVLAALRVARRSTWQCALAASLLSLVALSSHPLFVWLSAVAWVSTAVGGRDAVWLVFLVPYLTSAAGLVGMVTGVALHVPLPLRRGEAEVETYGISRHA